MLAALLAILALAGGCAATYAIMDEPRKRALKQLRRLEDDRADLAERMTALDDWQRRLGDQKRSLDAAKTDYDRRMAELTAATLAFDARVVTYNDLSGENQILKENLKSAAAHTAYQECAQEELRRSLDAVTDSLRRVGADAFADARAAALKAVTPSNYPAVKQRLQGAVGRLRAAGVGPSPVEEGQALVDLHAQYERAVRASVEREEQARLRDQIREEQRRERDAKEAIERAERERRTIQEALDRAVADASGRHAAEIDLLRAQLAEAEAKSQRAVSQAQLTKVGTVYVISNLGSFGQGVFKIGMTRRLDPMDRVHELGDASVPFPFDVHMMIACNDAPKLEAELHHAFRTRRVNRVNLRKEFFRVGIAEVAEAVRKLHGDVDYEADAEALEFIQSQRMSDKELAEVEEAYAKAEAATPAGLLAQVED